MGPNSISANLICGSWIAHIASPVYEAGDTGVVTRYLEHVNVANVRKVSHELRAELGTAAVPAYGHSSWNGRL